MDQPHWLIGTLADRGRVRAHNQDALATGEGLDAGLLASKGMVCVVADGFGKGGSGAQASDLAVRMVVQEYYAHPSADVQERLLYAIEQANLAIIRQAAQAPAYVGMGTTLVAAVIRGAELTVANAGDSRAYLILGRSIAQLTRDHSWVAEEVRSGRLTEAQARGHPKSRHLTRTLGTQPGEPVDLRSFQLAPGDRLLLCSDGLSDLVSDEEIRGIAGRMHPQAAANQLVALANQRGGADNIAVVVVQPPGAGTKIPLVPLAAGAAALLFVLLAALLSGRGGVGTPTPTITAGTATVAGFTGTPSATETPLPPIVSDTPLPPPPSHTPAPSPTIPTGTPTPGMVYAAPELVEPGDLAAYAGAQAVIVLTWKSAGALGAGEYYAVTILYPHGGATWREILAVQEPNVQVPRYLFDLLSEPRTCRWSVAVMRRTGTDAEGKPVGVAISPRSPERTFAWTLEASTPTPTVTPTSTPTPSPTFQRPQ